ncbi:MAG: tRNA (adenosine(37)-N6)-threonylcarbamoyltransferase complex dimerization subunit type 1 TsaB [Cardiobacteriaceae bacterium]|nr:tRNA (adenosine(37)-N6)-threonylcarbamoyltransferase complex dimerization subunit type 1 TsaB [Cardiobacteriaceae bacterium]
MTFSTLLAIDTSTPACSVALQHDGVITCDITFEARKHTEVLLPMCDRLLTRAGGRADGIILSAGPGAFTGLRVGASMALGLATAWNAPILPVSSLALLAATAARGATATVLALLDARMQAVYAGLYRVDGNGVAALAPDRLCAPDAIEADWYAQADIIAGPGLAYGEKAFARVARALPDCLPEADQAFRPMLDAKWQSAAEPLDLFYLRNDITQP